MPDKINYIESINSADNIINSELKEGLFYEDQILPTLNKLKEIKDTNIQNSVINILNNFNDQTSREQLVEYTKQLNTILISYEVNKGLIGVSSDTQLSQVSNDVSNNSNNSQNNDSGEFRGLASLDGDGYVGEGFGTTGVVGTVTGAVTGTVDKVTDAVDAGVDAYKEKRDKLDKEFLNKQVLELNEELSKLELSGKMSPEEFEIQLDLILQNEKFQDISDDKKLEIRGALLSLKEEQQIQLGKVNNFIDSLYRPNEDPKAVFFKDENGQDKKLDFKTQEEAQEFIKNLKFLAEEEFNNSWVDAISDFFGDASEWVLPYTNLRNKKEDWLDYLGLIYEIFVTTSIFLIIGKAVVTGPYESLKRRTKDILGNIDTENKRFSYETQRIRMSGSNMNIDPSSEEGKEILELRDRREILDKLYLEAQNDTDMLRKVQELEDKFLYRKTNTFKYKAYEIAEKKGILYKFNTTLFQGMIIGNIKIPFTNIKIVPWGTTINSSQKYGERVKNNLEYENRIGKGAELFFKVKRDMYTGIYEKKDFKEDKLQNLLLFAKQKHNLTDAQLRNLEKFIRNLKEVDDYPENINRKIQILIEKPDLIINDSQKQLIIDEIVKLEKELEDSWRINFSNRNSLNKRINHLQSLLTNVESYNWIGTEQELKDTIEGISKDGNRYNHKLPSGFVLVNDYVNSREIEGGRLGENLENYKKFISEKDRSSKIKGYIDYLVPTNSESIKRESFEKLSTSYLENLDDYYKKIGEILDIPDFDTKNISDLLNSIDNQLNTINIKSSDSLSRIGIDVDSDGKVTSNYLTIEEKIKEHYGLNNLEGESKRDLDDELKKLINSITSGNKYTIGQLTYLIDNMLSGSKYEDMININWKTSGIDFSLDGRYIKLRLQTPFDNNKKFNEFLDGNNRIEKVKTYIEFYSGDRNKLDLLRDLSNFKGDNIEEYYHKLADILDLNRNGLSNLNDFDKAINNKLDTIPERQSIDFNNFLNNYKTHNTIDKILLSLGIDNNVKSRIPNFSSNILPELNQFIDSMNSHKYTVGQASYVINEIFNGIKFSDINLPTSNQINHLDYIRPKIVEDTINSINEESKLRDEQLRQSQIDANKAQADYYRSNNNQQNQGLNQRQTVQEDLTEKSKEVGKILDRLETQLLLEGNLSDENKKKILEIQNQYLDRNKLEGLDINSFNGYLEREFSIGGIKTAKDLKTLIKAKDILDVNDNKINFDIDFKISDFIKGVREGKFKLKL